MFTGIVEDRGVVTSVTDTEGGSRIEVHTDLAATLAIGDSMAVNGVCLTAIQLGNDTCAFEVVPETLFRTNLGDMSVGDRVNLERAMPAGGRFDGHIVQGHVDGRGTVSDVASEGDGIRLRVAVDDQLLGYLVDKGSITINGVSLTVAAVDDDGFEVALIPHTLEVTNLGDLGIGTSVNLEADIIAKYVERIMERRL